MIIDAPLTEQGREQAEGLRGSVAALGIEAVVTSPLTRAVQTSLTISQGLDLPIHVDALHREYVWSSCDVGRSPAVLSHEFPHLRFDHLSDPWWWCPSGRHQQVDKEPAEIVMNRVQGFLKSLQDRPERNLAVVGHCTFFWLFTGIMLENCQVLTINPHTHRIPEAPPPPPGL